MQKLMIAITAGTLMALVACGPAPSTNTQPSSRPSSGSTASGTPSTGGTTSASPTPPPVAPKGNEKAVITGLIQRVAGENLNDAKVVLTDTSDRVVSSVRTSPDGRYRFANLGAGNYRVRFSLSEDDAVSYMMPYRKDQARTTQFFHQIASQAIGFDGAAARTIEVSPFIVGWDSNLQPPDGEINLDRTVTFSWNPPPRAKSYQLEIYTESGAPFFRSETLSKTEFDYANPKGNLGSYNGQVFAKGQTYQYRVRVELEPGTSPGAEYGVSTAPKITTRNK